MTTTTVTKKNNTVLFAAILLAIVGIGAWAYQLITGMQVTGLSNQIVWGGVHRRLFHRRGYRSWIAGSDRCF